MSKAHRLSTSEEALVTAGETRVEDRGGGHGDIGAAGRRYSDGSVGQVFD